MADYRILGLIFGASAFAGIVCKIVVLVVVLGAVRRHRPDAYSALAVWAGASIGCAALVWLLNALAPVVLTQFGLSIFAVQGIDAVAGVVVNVLLTLLLVQGLVRLAQPAKPVSVAVPPYR